ncbi:MAG: hypothetical protein O2885_00120, partial [Proteobacteria bacterium]|nr:hypothetical protein [Pseudomonadota bacterium]
MQCPHCAHPDSISYGTSRSVEHYRYQACRRIFQTIRRGKDPALKQQACQLYLEGMEMRAIGRVLSIHHKTVSRWWCNLPKYSQQALHRPKHAPSSKSMNSAHSSLKKIPMLALASGRLHLWQGPR